MFTDATPSPSLLNPSGNTPLQLTNGELQHSNSFSSAHTNSNMPIVTISSNFSHITPADGQQNLLFTTGNPGDDGNGGNNGGGLINPLHGLGLNVEHYPTLLQNLLGTSGDALDAMEFDPSLLNDSMLGGPGDAMLTSFGGPSMLNSSTGMPGSSVAPGTASSSPNAGGPSSSPNNAHKRQREDDMDASNSTAPKRSRFEIVE